MPPPDTSGHTDPEKRIHAWLTGWQHCIRLSAIEWIPAAVAAEMLEIGLALH
jgi:hypothetical protein